MRRGSFALLGLVVACSAPSPAPPAPSVDVVEVPTVSSVRAPTVSRAAPGAIEELAVPGDLPVLVVRGDSAGTRLKTVFLPGSCDRPEVYLGALRPAAAKRGGLVALQGDKPCPGPDPRLRRWSSDAAASAARIEAALQAVGEEDTRDLTLVGYSQGAERAEWIAAKFPGKFKRLVLVAGPIVPSASRLSGAEAVVTMAGRGDVRENMALGARALRKAKIPAIYMELPSHHHGELDPRADASFDKAFEWLDQEHRAPEAARPAARAHLVAPRRGDDAVSSP